ncbi:MAG: FAD-dependent oxidoreductase [Rhodoglobus sp.]
MNQVLIIGAGPAGLAAAQSARQAGAEVILLDSSDSLGGQYWRHLPANRPAKKEAILHHGWALFQSLVTELVGDSGCEIISGAHVWAIETGTRPVVHAVIGEPDGRGRKRMSFHPTAIVIATGAYDRTLPFPGWDLPGVFTAGAAQALAKGERLAVGQRVVVAGAGPFLLPVTQSLAAAGSHVVAVLEANRALPLIRGWLPKAWQLLPAASKGLELAGYVAGHLRHRIPYLLGRTVIAAHGTSAVESVTTARLDHNWVPISGTEKVIAVDAVCVSHSFAPRLELALAAGCRLTPDRFVQVDRDQRSTVEGVFAAGEITGIGGVDLSLAEGSIAGHNAAGGAGIKRSLERKRKVFEGFAARIEAAHGIKSGWPAWLSDSTTICRCEEVSYGSLCATAHTTDSRSLRSLKLSTRAGLGICQGRICGRTIEDLLARQTPDGALTDGSSSDRRPIAVPIRLAELASAPETHP